MANFTVRDGQLCAELTTEDELRIGSQVRECLSYYDRIYWDAMRLPKSRCHALALLGRPGSPSMVGKLAVTTDLVASARDNKEKLMRDIAELALRMIESCISHTLDPYSRIALNTVSLMRGNIRDVDCWLGLAQAIVGTQPQYATISTAIDVLRTAITVWTTYQAWTQSQGLYDYMNHYNFAHRLNILHDPGMYIEGFGAIVLDVTFEKINHGRLRNCDCFLVASYIYGIYKDFFFSRTNIRANNFAEKMVKCGYNRAQIEMFCTLAEIPSPPIYPVYQGTLH